jgi:hypothetical protein
MIATPESAGASNKVTELIDLSYKSNLRFGLRESCITIDRRVREFSISRYIKNSDLRKLYIIQIIAFRQIGIGCEYFVRVPWISF